VRGLGVVDAETVDEHQRLLEGASSDRNVGLQARRAALLDIDGGVSSQIIFYVLERERMFFGVHDHHRAGGLALSDRIEGTQDDDCGVGGRDLSGLLLG